MIERLKKVGSGLFEGVRFLFDGIKEKSRVEEYSKQPVNLEDGTDINDDLVEIFNDAFPEKGFTKENIKDILQKAQITNGEFVAILEAYNLLTEGQDPKDHIPKSVLEKISSI